MLRSHSDEILVNVTRACPTVGEHSWPDVLPDLIGSEERRLNTTSSRVSGLGSGRALLRRSCLWSSLFKSNLNIYELHNNGAWYNFGYLFGLACFFGGGGNRAARWTKPR